MSTEKVIPEDDPDTYLIESSVPDVRAFEKKTRIDIETQKKELRAMVGEQYLDLISAADAIITMSKNAQAIQTNFERMQSACDVESIKRTAKKKIQQRDENDQSHIDTKRKYVYIIAALVKSLADVPEQIWHALENHRYLHASRLYVLAKLVHEYLETEKTKSTIDIEVAFPVIQKQWDAVSAFGPQIIQRSTHYLRVSEQSSEHIAEILVGLMLLEQSSYKESMKKLLEMRTRVIRDIIENYSKSNDTATNRVSHQLREIILIVKHTLQQTFDIFYSKENYNSTLLEYYVNSFQKTFLIPSKSSHGNETPSQPAITRLFSPSSNVHLIVRYLPESIQKYLPEFEPAPILSSENIQELVQSWLEQVQNILKEKVPETLLSIQSHADLIQVRSKLLELLNEDENEKNSNWQTMTRNLLGCPYSIWDNLLRDAFNTKFKLIISQNLEKLANQPELTVWPLITDSSKSQHIKKDFSLTINIWPDVSIKQSAFNLPNFSSSEKIRTFKKSLTETANDITETLSKAQNIFDSCLSNIRKDVQNHLVDLNYENFHLKSDTDMIKVYFQENVYQSILNYSENIKKLIKQVEEWTSDEKKTELSIFLGRLAKNIAYLSKELPKALSLSVDTTPIFELRSINKDPKYTAIQNELVSTYQQAHSLWINWLENTFAQKLKVFLSQNKWNDKCSSISVWEKIEEDIKLPTQSSNDIVRILFYICEEIQSINSAMLDQTIMVKLRQQLYDSINNVYDKFLSDIESTEITENGALQLMFDYMFLLTVFQDVKKSSIGQKILEKLQDQIDPINWDSYESYFKPNVNKFYTKQSLIFGVLTSATNETYERARKVMSNQQQGQHNVLPLASQATRFTLLPIGHLTSSSVRAR